MQQVDTVHKEMKINIMLPIYLQITNITTKFV